MKYKVVYLGNVAQAAEYIAFNSNFELVQIICEQDRINEDLMTVSLLRDVPLIPVANQEQLQEKMYHIECDFFIMFSFGMIIPKSITENLEIYNIHGGYLPDYKGRHPTYWASVNNEKYLGITLHKVNHKIDAGEIIERMTVPYYFWMDENSLSYALSEKIVSLLDALVLYKQEKIKSIPNIGGRYDPPVSEEDKVISETEPYSNIFNKVRTQSKYDGAKIIIDPTTFILVKKARFLYGDCVEKRYYEQNGSLYWHIRDNIWLKSDDYKIVRMECK